MNYNSNVNETETLNDSDLDKNDNNSNDFDNDIIDNKPNDSDKVLKVGEPLVTAAGGGVAVVMTASRGGAIDVTNSLNKKFTTRRIENGNDLNDFYNDILSFPSHSILTTNFNIQINRKLI